MPLIKSKSKEALSKNIATEVRAGKPVAQAAAIGYSIQRHAQHPHHSSHSQRRSEHYHQHIAGTHIGRGATRMTRAEQQRDNREETDERL